MSSGKLAVVSEVCNFVKRCMIAAGTPEASASILADVLVTADYRGHFSHGLNRLEMYVNEVQGGQCDPNIQPKVVKETPGTAFVDGQNGIGMVVGDYCMELAIEKAKKVGVAWVTCTGSNHYGIAGYYALKAVKQGLILKNGSVKKVIAKRLQTANLEIFIRQLDMGVRKSGSLDFVEYLVGMSFTNTSPLVVPTRAKECILGTNPIAFGAPGKEDDYYMLDMATSSVAVGKIEMQKRKAEPLPPSWAVDSSGHETKDSVDVMDRGGGLLPLGGVEITSGYKGYGLGMMVETICGVLSGGPFAHHIRKWQDPDTSKTANLGQTFFALDPKCFAMGFEDRMQTFMDEMRQLDPAEASNPVKVAGDLSRGRMRGVDESKGIRYHDNHIASLNALASRLKVDPMIVTVK